MTILWFITMCIAIVFWCRLENAKDELMGQYNRGDRLDRKNYVLWSENKELREKLGMATYPREPQ